MTNDNNLPQENGRREFLKKLSLSTSLLTIGSSFAFGSSRESDKIITNEITKSKALPPEWRNKQDGMFYRQLGNTGIMLSEIVVGGAGINSERYKYLYKAIESGINYIDTASRYNKGRSEEGVGIFIKESGFREKLFIATKLSSYHIKKDELAIEKFNSLPASKQQLLRDKSLAMIEERGILKPGYFFRVFPPQEEETRSGYLTQAIINEYGYSKEWKSILKKELFATVEESLRRLNTDYIDILECPHGARLVEEIDDEVIHETMAEMKQQGKIRFTGVSIHTDVSQVLDRAAQSGKYDMAMVAYNIANEGIMAKPIGNAVAAGMGIVAMKGASIVNPPHEDLKPVPEWRIHKLNHVIPEEMKLPLKAYLFVLQNPNITAVINDFKNEEMIVENLSIVGKKTKLNLS